MSLFRTALDVLRPGKPEFKAHMARLTHAQARLTFALHLLESPGTKEVKAASDRAAEFQ